MADGPCCTLATSSPFRHPARRDLTVPYDLRLLLARKADVPAAVQRILATEVERAYQATTAPGARDAGEERRGGSVTWSCDGAVRGLTPCG